MPEPVPTNTPPSEERRKRPRRRFNLAHSIAGISLLLVIEGAFLGFADLLFGANAAGTVVVVIGALAGGLFIILMATEVIEEVRRPFHMLLLLSAVVFEFIVFFAFQYWFLSLVAPVNFESLQINPVDLLLYSTTVFALNPLYRPLSLPAQALLLINTLESLVLALFVLQNAWQFRRNAEAS